MKAFLFANITKLFEKIKSGIMCATLRPDFIRLRDSVRICTGRLAVADWVSYSPAESLDLFTKNDKVMNILNYFVNFVLIKYYIVLKLNDMKLTGIIIKNESTQMFTGFIKEHPGVLAQGSSIDQVKTKLNKAWKNYVAFLYKRTSDESIETYEMLSNA